MYQLSIKLHTVSTHTKSSSKINYKSIPKFKNKFPDNYLAEMPVLS